MRITRCMIIIFVLVSICFYSGCNTKEDIDKNIVAEYGNGGKITFDELNQYVIYWKYVRKYRVKSEAYRHALDDMVENQMKRIDFFESHLDTNSALMQSFSRIINEALVVSYYEKEYLSKYDNDEFAKKVYDIMDRRVDYREIILKKPEGASKDELSKIEKKALDIKTEIENGADFNSMIQKYSQDKQSVQSNGYAPPVGWKQSLSDPVGNVIFNLKENDIRVLSTNLDYRIIKVVKVNKIDIEPFEKIKNNIIDEIKQIYGQRSLDEFHRDKDVLIDTTSLKWNETALKQLVEWSNIQTLNSNAYEDSLARVMSKSDNKTIVTYKNGKVDYKEYLRLVKNILTFNVKRKINEDDIKYFIKEAVTTDKILQKADSLGLRKGFFNKNIKDPEIKGRLVYFYDQAEIEQKIPPLTEENLHNFYNDNRESIFYQLERRNIYAMFFNTEKEAKEIYNKIQSGIEYEKVTGRFFVKTYDRERNGEFKSLMRNEKPIFAEKAFKMKLNEVSEPVKFIDEDGQTKYAVLKCKYIRPEKQLTYEDTKKTIGEEFKKFYREKLEQEIKKKLAEKYHPKYYYDVVEKIISPNNAE